MARYDRRMPQPRPLMTRDDVEAFIDREFPQIHHGGRIYRIASVGPLSSRVRMDFSERHVRRAALCPARR
jgi:hypothetical protein